ncbi:hypothetical protein [Promicromonospora aerolata]|uniref:DUF3784 domain-containing protein n=1 Tax=Promicromonospora aerolata TaxID=195749 RepID=A0ABW4V9A5_9MICO
MTLYLIGLIIWRSLGYGKPINLSVEAKKFWGDMDEAAASVRAGIYLALGGLNLSVGALLVGIFGRSILQRGGFFEYFIFSFLGLILLAWSERQFAWPGFLVPADARGTRGLFRARREERRRARRGNGANGESSQGARPDS